MGSYVPNTEKDIRAMLDVIGVEKLEDLFRNIPDEVKIKGGLNLPEGKSEMEVKAIIEALAEKNKIYKSIFRGAGAYNHFIPATVGTVISKENLLTAYTPYQAEISQGILQSIFEYQTMICEITGMDVSNACVYDGGTAAAEAVKMIIGRKTEKVFVSSALNPQYIEVIKTYCFGNGMDLVFVPEKDGVTDIDFIKENMDATVGGVLVQNPNFYGNIEDCSTIADIVHEAKGKLVMVVNPIASTVIKNAAECGADVAVGEGQPLGLPISFGGPYIGFMACTDAMKRNLPGRIVGQTTDTEGKIGYVLTLQAREQHIRREKASSNICSNEALCALAVGVYCSIMGKKGIVDAATLSMSKAHYMADQLAKAGLTIVNKGEFFNEFVTESKACSCDILKALDEKGILGGYPIGDNQILWCCTECNTKEQIDCAVEIVKEVAAC